MSKRRDIVLNSRIDAARCNGEIRKRCLAARRLPWPGTCGTEEGIIGEQLHVVGQEIAGGVIGKYSCPLMSIQQ